MDWTKISTNLIINHLSDNEIVAIVKYQLLWALMECEPDDLTALRYMTNKQLMLAKSYRDVVETILTRDIRYCNQRRGYSKNNYLKNKTNF